MLFWTKALRFAGALVAREQFLPGLAQRTEAVYARWEPVFLGDDAGRLAVLAGAMPHACRALTREADAAPEAAPAAVLTDLLGDLVDYLVRTAVLGQPLSSLRHRARAARSFDSLHDQWVHTLRAPAGPLDADKADLAHLAGQIKAWRRPISASTRTPFRLSFRLEEPEAAEPSEAVAADLGPWYVR